MKDQLLKYKKSLSIGKMGFWTWDAITNETVWGDEKFMKQLHETQPIQRIGLPEEISFAALYLASDEASYVTGQTIVIDGGSTC